MVKKSEGKEGKRHKKITNSKETSLSTSHSPTTISLLNSNKLLIQKRRSTFLGQTFQKAKGNNNCNCKANEFFIS